MVPFKGDVCDFVRFWPQFETEIDHADISEVSKLNYLNSLLRGKPSNDIQGLFQRGVQMSKGNPLRKIWKRDNRL